jgi:hypothetical protein
MKSFIPCVCKYFIFLMNKHFKWADLKKKTEKNSLSKVMINLYEMQYCL